MTDLLFLVHRIPYPPRKGDKVRSYHQLKYLAERYRVHLGTFVDDPEDLAHVDAVREMCASLSVHRLRPRLSRAFSARALATGEALSVAYFRSSRLGRWVRHTMAAHHVTRVLVFSSSMAQYALGHLRPGVHGVIDFVDVDSEKWRNYSELHAGAMSWVYRREGRRLLAHERDLAARFDASVFVSREEADLFRRLAPESASKVEHVGNGVDARYFDPALEHDDPYPPGGPTLVFTGAMDYRANVDAVVWFCEHVLTLIRDAVPGVRFYVVGANPTPAVRRLAGAHGVTVTGTVPDVRPYLRHADVSVAPLRVARGVQNKVLEAMAMGLPVVATRAAVEGIEAGHGLEGWLADEPAEMARRVQAAVATRRDSAAGDRVRRFVLERYDWSARVAQLTRLIEQRG
jgi:sugar transferase (PEP-CTERM/EpsH1 system associated)